MIDFGMDFLGLCYFRFFRNLDPILAQFWLHFGASGPHLGSILEVFGSMLAPFWRYVGPFGRKTLH